MILLLRHNDGELGPKSLREWLTPNGADDTLLSWMLKEIEARHGDDARVELVTIEGSGMTGYFVETRP